jgi:hypothetical protein
MNHFPLHHRDKRESSLFLLHTCCRSLLRWRELGFLFGTHSELRRSEHVGSLFVFCPRRRCAAEEAIVETRYAAHHLVFRSFLFRVMHGFGLRLVLLGKAYKEFAYFSCVSRTAVCRLHFCSMYLARLYIALHTCGICMRVKHRALLWTRRLGRGLLVLPMRASGPSGYCGSWIATPSDGRQKNPR